MNYKPGDIVTKRNSDDSDRYIYLGKATPINHLGIENQNELGWFATYPIRPTSGGYESHVPIYAWFINMLEKAGT